MNTKIVNIRNQHVALAWKCPHCGKPRGKIFKTISYIGSRRVKCDGWKNKCGHVDLYDDCLKEAKHNNLNDIIYYVNGEIIKNRSAQNE